MSTANLICNPLEQSLVIKSLDLCTKKKPSQVTFYIKVLILVCQIKCIGNTF